ncbi:hypothetical protein D9M71_456300 [compost metagenome]
MADVDDLARAVATDQETRYCFDGLLRGRQADAQQRFGAECLQAFKAQGQMAAALAGGHGMDFVDDHRLCRTEHLPTGVGTEQHVQGFRCGHQNVRRRLAHRRAVFLRCIAGAHGGADLQFGQAHHAQLLGNAGQRVLQVDLDVVGQCLEGRDVDHQGCVGQAFGAFQAAVHQVVDDGEKRGEGLAGAGGRGDQGRAALADQWPRPGLGGGDRCECVAEPGADGGVEAAQGTVCGDGQVHAASYAGGGRKMQVPLGDLYWLTRPLRGQARSHRGSAVYPHPVWERACPRRGQ